MTSPTPAAGGCRKRYRIAVKNPEWRWWGTHGTEPIEFPAGWDARQAIAMLDDGNYRVIESDASGNFTLPDAPPEAAGMPQSAGEELDDIEEYYSRGQTYQLRVIAKRQLAELATAQARLGEAVGLLREIALHGIHGGQYAKLMEFLSQESR